MPGLGAELPSGWLVFCRGSHYTEHELPSALSMAVESQGKQAGVGTISHIFIRYLLGGRNVLNPRDAKAIKSDTAPAFTELTGQ